jgi:hypothetical protein
MLLAPWPDAMTFPADPDPFGAVVATGAVCGQLAGAFWGEANIPGPLRSGLARMDMPEGAPAGTL